MAANRSYKYTLRDGRVVCLRAVVPTDGPEIIEAFQGLSEQTRYARFMHHKRTLSPEEVAQAIRPRPGVACAILAIDVVAGKASIVGGAQYVPDGGLGEDAGAGAEAGAGSGSHHACEFALTVADDWQRSGLGRRLLASLIRRARRDGYLTIKGLVLASNAPMLALARKLKFVPSTRADDPGVVVVSRSLMPQRGSANQSRQTMLIDGV